MDRLTDLTGGEDATVSVTLGDTAASAKARIDAGEFENVSEAVQEGLRALDREDEEMEALWRDKAWVSQVRAKVQEALNDPRPPLSQSEFKERMDEFIKRYRAEHGL